MKNLNTILEKIYNTLGNKYITDNFDSEPFEFKVNIRSGNRDDDFERDFVIEIYSIPDMPNGFTYKPGKSEYNGIHISLLKREFLDYIKYVDSSFGGFRKTIGIKFMNVK